jgi:RNA polymerase sigma-70 factor (ECF subfamily)
MRHVLVNHARDRSRLKRGGGQAHIPTFSGVEVEDHERALVLDVLILDEAITELAEVDPRKATVLELKFFAGMTIQQIARVMELSEAQIKREWKSTRAYLMSKLDEGDTGGF